MEVDASQQQDVAHYCREIERYLCQKNGGHLVRVVGPAFEEVRGWAEQGIPLKVVFRGIDQRCERSAATSGRRRPVRIEFCAADILALFDAWRRAIGVAPVDAGARTRKPSLASHIERVVARLMARRETEGAAPLAGNVIDDAVKALDAIAASSRTARGDARQGLIAELDEIDRRLLHVVTESLDQATAVRLRREAEEELAPFGQRIAAEARATALDGAFGRLVREHARLPRLTFE